MKEDMSTNDTYTEKISLWLDNELSPTEVTELQAHLPTCATCRQTYNAMRRVDHLFRDAARVMVSPTAEFTQRFETRLANYQPNKPWQIWVAVVALLLGSLFFFGAWVVASGLTLVTVSASVLDVGILYQLVVRVIDSLSGLYVLFNLGTLFLKAGFLTVGQPLFWGMVVVAMTMVGLWMRVLQVLARRTGMTLGLMI